MQMQLRTLGTSGLKISPLVLGGNVFGWTADRDTSFAILDTFLAAGGNAIDTADVYNRYAPGMQGGESESVIGEWMKDRGVRDRIVIITKGGLSMGEGMEGLGRDYLPRACEASLRRLQTDYIDVYMSHRADPNVPIEETLETYRALIDAGKVRVAGCSNYTAAELAAALAASGGQRARYEVLEPHYNLAARKQYEDELEQVCVEHSLGVIPYFALAAGFLTGKYRSKEDLAGRARERTAASYMTERNLRLLDTMDGIARRHDASLAQIALAWLLTRPSITAPIVSATSVQQLTDILRSTEVRLSDEDIAALAAASD
jgi:aryl-alcohol dehydrogenase-like predicted oxidoreductase